MNNAYHYPPELFKLIVDTIPKLCRSKQDVLTFFRGAGVEYAVFQDLQNQLSLNRDSIDKYRISHTILQRINDNSDKYLRARREIIKRICEFEDFTRCWSNDIMEAKGLVAEIQRVVNIKDTFTRIDIQRQEERKKRISESEEKAKNIEKRNLEFDSVKKDLFSLFSETNPQKRGKILEIVLNRLFKLDNILIRESFTIQNDESGKIGEQIDGVIALDGQVYLVEMKWLKDPVGKGDISNFLVNIFNRGQTRGFFISASGYTSSALSSCKELLTKCVFALSTIEEFVFLFDNKNNLREFLKTKIEAAMTEKNPFVLIK